MVKTRLKNQERPGTRPFRTFDRELSCGGLVLKSGKVLMVNVRNLEGRIVWTFPKGHVEPGESRKRTALREVLEETGWRCEVRGLKPFHTVRYRFKRAKRAVRKSVVWFLMRPSKRTGRRDPDEIRKVRWFSLSKAMRKASYGSDQELLKCLASHRSKTGRKMYNQ